MILDNLQRATDWIADHEDDVYCVTVAHGWATITVKSVAVLKQLFPGRRATKERFTSTLYAYKLSAVGLDFRAEERVPQAIPDEVELVTL